MVCRLESLAGLSGSPSPDTLDRIQVPCRFPFGIDTIKSRVSACSFDTDVTNNPAEDGSGRNPFGARKENRETNSYDCLSTFHFIYPNRLRPQIFRIGNSGSAAKLYRQSFSSPARRRYAG